ncbi:MAG: hypothetical protein E7632_09890 [Ruminococcaceae bacterium]|nr:hypothetical protein [Oscillospiraceae bacterium]
MKPIDFSSIIPKIQNIIDRHKLADGSYGRWPGDTQPNPYGCADAANILYSIGNFPSCPAERAEWVKVLQGMQDPETGLFTEATHHTIHTTAHCMAAIELFDASPLHRAYALEQYMDKEKMAAFFDTLRWIDSPWDNSHRGAGLYVALNLGGSDCVQFNRDYFAWLWENADPETGFWRKGCQDGTRPIWHHMAGSFHYLFNHEHTHMPLRYPEKVIDSCLDMYKNRRNEHPSFGKTAGFMEIDWIFCLTRAKAQTPHRWEEATAALEAFAAEYAQFWMNADFETDKNLNDLHMLFGAVCALAELQRDLRGRILTEKPLKLVLDRRPFI